MWTTPRPYSNSTVACIGDDLHKGESSILITISASNNKRVGTSFAFPLSICLKDPCSETTNTVQTQEYVFNQVSC